MWHVKIIRVDDFAGDSLKFCWRILNFAGAVFEAKVVPAKDSRQQNSAGARQKISYRHSTKLCMYDQPKNKKHAQNNYPSCSAAAAAGLAEAAAGDKNKGKGSNGRSVVVADAEARRRRQH